MKGRHSGPYVVLVLSSLFLFIGSAELGAQRKPPGAWKRPLQSFHGYFHTTRWGHQVFHVGPHHVFLAESVARSLEPRRGRPLELKASKISQPIDPGGRLIEKIAEVSETGFARGLALSVRSRSKKVRQGRGLRLKLTLRNQTHEELTIRPRSLAVVLATDSPFRNRDIGYEDPEQRAYWSYRKPYPGRGEQPAMTVACRKIPLPWSPQELAAKSRKVRSNGGELIFAPQALLELELVVGQELLPDDYEVFLYLAGDRHFWTPAGPMSNRLAFDVVE